DRAPELQDLAGGLVDGNGPAVLLDELHEAVGGIQAELHSARMLYEHTFALYFRATARPVSSSRTTRSATSAVMSAEPIGVGSTSTTSPPTSSVREAISRTAQSRSTDVIPPGSGVPVPGANAGSSTSTSTVRKTGPAPTVETARATTSRMPSSRTSCMKKAVIPCSRCQANSAAPGQ